MSGMILAIFTMRLFSFVDLDIGEFYFSNVVLFGAAALAIVTAYLVSMNLKLAKNITPYISKIFSPLVLITLLIYLITVILVGKIHSGSQFPNGLQRNTAWCIGCYYIFYR